MRQTASPKTGSPPVPVLRPVLGALLSACLLLGLGACARLGLTPGEPPAAAGPDVGSGEAEAPAPPAEALPGIAYQAEITGVPEADLKDILEKSSHLLTLRDRPPSTMAGLQRRIDGDRERLTAALRSEGFYSAKVTAEIDRTAKPIKVTLQVATGVVYLLADYDIRYQGAGPPATGIAPTLGDLGLHIGMPARAPAIVAAQRALINDLTRRGYPLAKVLDRKTLVDHATTTMAVTLDVETGPQARFGATTIEGLTHVKQDYVRGLIDWSPGQRYDSDKVERTRQALAKTGLFASAVVEPAAEVAPDGTLPVSIRLTEGKHRSVGFGASYSTSEGFAGDVFWEHRNILGRNEQLRLGLTAAEIEQVLEAKFRKPAFLRRDQDLLVQGTAANRTTDAFNERSVTGEADLERPWREHWRVSAGVSGEYSVIKDEDSTNSFQLVGLPLKAAFDNSDDLLNPTKGARLNLALTPYAGSGDRALLFNVASVAGTTYQAIDRDRRFVLAGRAKVGSIVGEQTDDIPANKRFYAGGGGSIRGYEFQKVGPLDADGDPLGGSSVIEVNGELRVRVTEEIGIVPFVDGGTVFDNPYPDFKETVRWAAGLGGRYFSIIGPVRVDVAFPINKRNIDDTFQFYISLGQAF